MVTDYGYDFGSGYKATKVWKERFRVKPAGDEVPKRLSKVDIGLTFSGQKVFIAATGDVKTDQINVMNLRDHLRASRIQFGVIG